MSTDAGLSRPDPGPEPAPFAVCGPLPEPGTTVLEASAGTGKTFTIAALMTRMVAEGHELSDILAVTFTRMATGELRDRIRARMVSAEEGIGRWLGGGGRDGSDEVLVALTDGPENEVARRHQRLNRALASFDSATITTTHTFCQLVLAGMGVAGEVAEGAALLEDPRDLVEEVVDDLYLRRVLSKGSLEFDRDEAGRIGRAAVANPDAELEPPGDDSLPGRRRRLAERVRHETNRRLRDTNLLTYDDLLIRLRNALRDPERGAVACERLRRRYRIVLVDEFQDTDPVQWEVVRRAFGDGQTILVLIGDPKQAIYAFRGADVYAYLSAARGAARQFSLGVNWRSDAALITALEALLHPLRLGHADILYRPVRPASDHGGPGLVGAPHPEALRVRVMHRRDHQVATVQGGLFQKDAAVELVARDLAADIVSLLESSATLAPRGSERSKTQPEPVSPRHIAVLVRANRQAGVVQAALRQAGVPAVVAGAESVFRAPAAQHWLDLLAAIEAPSDRSRAVAVALTPFVGLRPAEVARADEGVWEDLQARVQHWGELLRRQGVAALARGITSGEGLPARVLREEGGERLLTDLGHVAQLLHTEAVRSQSGLSALRAWLARRLAEAGQDDTDADERARRLDTDADAVQVLTVHRAKGLEFPIVYCPFLWDPGGALKKGPPLVFHDPDDAMVRKLDVGGSGGENGLAYDRHMELARHESRGEDLRHLYVALTRARHQVVMWWAPIKDCHHSPLGRLLMQRGPAGTVAVSGAIKEPKDAEVVERLESLRARAHRSLSVERARPPVEAAWASDGDQPGSPLGLAVLSRRLDREWRRTSYSAITSSAHGDLVGSEPEDPGTVDEPTEASAPRTGMLALGAEIEVGLRRVPSELGNLPGRAEVGTFIHAVLEATDFAAPDLGDELRRAVGSMSGPPPGPPGTLEAGLAAALATPLGPLVGGLRLQDIQRHDRLDEVGFELPLAGGDRPVGRVLTADVAGVLRRHLPPGAPLSGYPDRLADPLLATNLRGYLTGSIDLVLRAPGPASGPDTDGAPRYFVVDYKSNWLGSDGEELSAWHYRPGVLEAEMQRLHYPLQAVLYLVALHRYLRWRLADYDPRRHLGGVLYLFLRGMTGPANPQVDGQPCGVFSWATPPALVSELSELLASGSTDPA